MINFIPVKLDEIRPMFSDYLSTLSDVNDDFWEEHILKCQIYRIVNSSQDIGFTGIYNKENMTLFYIPLSYARYSQAAFDAALEAFHPLYAFVPTNDELFLSLCMDRHKKIDMQAYFFKHSENAVREAKFGRELLRIAVPEDAADILDTEGVEENIRLGKYYVMRKDGIFLGQGFFNPLNLTPNTASIGMSVHPDHRQKGVGRSIIMHLADICREKGITPYCGCWYYNHNSKRTLESAGFATKTRLLKVWFTEEKQ